MNTQPDNNTNPNDAIAGIGAWAEAEFAVKGVYSDLVWQTGFLRRNYDEQLMPPDFVWGYVWEMIAETYQIGDAWYGPRWEQNPAPFDEELVERLHEAIWDYIYSCAVAAGDRRVTVHVLDQAWAAIFYAFEDHDLIAALTALAGESTS